MVKTNQHIFISLLRGVEDKPLPERPKVEPWSMSDPWSMHIYTIDAASFFYQWPVKPEYRQTGSRITQGTKGLQRNGYGFQEQAHVRPAANRWSTKTRPAFRSSIRNRHSFLFEIATKIVLLITFEGCRSNYETETKSLLLCTLYSRAAAT